MTEFTLRLAFLFLPGIVAFLIIDKLTYHKAIQSLQFVLYSLLLGILCYLSYFGLFVLGRLAVALNSLLHNGTAAFTFPKLIFFEALRSANDKMLFSYREIFWVTLLGIPLGYLISLMINRKYMVRIGRFIRASNKLGDADVWSYLMNSPQLAKWPWVVVRDKKNDMMYLGKLQLFSDEPGQAEIYLIDVDVYKESVGGDKLYSVSGLYLPSTRSENIEVEFYFDEPLPT